MLANLLLTLLTCLPAPALQDPVPDPPREFRGAWIATVDNIDWPSKPGLPTQTQQAELDAMLDLARDLGLNALVFQVRTQADALYESKLEPWSEWLTGTEGKAPSPRWDPLTHAVEGAHRRGLELHAWINPYRTRLPASKSANDPTHVNRRHRDWVVQYGKYQWMDPGNQAGLDWTVAVIEDLVARYDLDGLHYDDYFYPYPIKGIGFPDQDSFARYQRGGGKLALADWRRDNVNRMVQRVHAAVHQKKPWVRVGISPFGIARPGVPQGIRAGIDQFADLYADVLHWNEQGWFDYLAPQLYWPIDQKPQSFAVLLPWWATTMQHDRHLWVGLSIGRAAEAKAPWRQGELLTQLDLMRRQAGCSGHILFSFKVLRENRGQLATLLREQGYRHRAAVPASPWRDAAVPAAPEVRGERRGGALHLSWSRGGDHRFLCVQARVGGEWRLLALCDAAGGTAEVALPAGVQDVAARWLSRTGVAGAAVRLP